MKRLSLGGFVYKTSFVIIRKRFNVIPITRLGCIYMCDFAMPFCSLDIRETMESDAFSGLEASEKRSTKILLKRM
jgi:hypothetical protein